MSTTPDQYCTRYLRLLRAPDEERAERQLALELDAAQAGVSWDQVEAVALRSPELAAEQRDRGGCRVCGCTRQAECPDGCDWVFDPAGGLVCSLCLTAVWSAVRRSMMGVELYPEEREILRLWAPPVEAFDGRVMAAPAVWIRAANGAPQ